MSRRPHMSLRVPISMVVFAAGLTALAQNGDRTNDFQGRWMTVEVETNGEKEKDQKVLKRLRVKVVGDTIDFEPAGTVWRAKFKVDPTTSPKSIELTRIEDGQP